MKKTLLTLCICCGLWCAAQAQIVITEIMYNPPESGTDTLEYVELYNNSNSAVDVSNWTFTQGFEFTFAAGTTILAHSYVVIAKNAAYFQARFGFTPLEWAMNGALTNSGEDIELRDANGTVIDYVDYKNTAPWPTEPNGTGPSLVLCDPSSDNSLPESWQAANTPTGIIINGKEVKANPGAGATCGSGPTFPVRTIAEVTNENGTTGVADSVGANVTLQGTVYGVNLRGTTGLQFTLIDDSNNGIAVFSPSEAFGYTVQEGDNITVQGFIGQFNGLTQLLPQSIQFNSGGNNLITPFTVVNADESAESSLIRITGLHLVDPAEWDTTGNAAGFTVRAVATAHPADTVYIRIDNNTDIYLHAAPQGNFDLIGIGGQFDSSNPYTSGYQVQPRYLNDISVFVATKEADFSAHVQLSPNPASTYLHVQTDLAFDRLYLFSATGRLVRMVDTPGQQTRIQLDGLATGVYFVRFEKAGAVWTARVIKM